MKFFDMIKGMLTSAPHRAPSDCVPKIISGEAFLVDVREPDEWVKGVAKDAVLLSLRDLAGSREKWAPFLAGVGDREIILYCGAGVRAGMAARLLVSEGFRAVNSGSLNGWTATGWPQVAAESGS